MTLRALVPASLLILAVERNVGFIDLWENAFRTAACALRRLSCLTTESYAW
jgi:hypothetical protein